MSDIHDCQNCKDKVYMDNAEHCVVCSSWFCEACDYENGQNLYDEENDNYYYVCKDCLEKGLDYINKNNEDDAKFTKKEYNKSLRDLHEKQINKEIK